MSFLENIQNNVTNYTSNVKDVLENHTIVGRMVNNGDSLFEAIKNDLSEDTTIGRMLTQDEGFLEAYQNAAENNLGAAGIIAQAATGEDEEADEAE